jgi:hypothetical protein
MIPLADCGPDYERIPGPTVVIGEATIDEWRAQAKKYLASCRQNRAESSSSLKWWRNKGIETGGQRQSAHVRRHCERHRCHVRADARSEELWNLIRQGPEQVGKIDAAGLG